MRSVAITDRSAVAAARQEAAALAAALRFDAETTGRAMLITVELCTNLIKHAGHGTLLIGSTTDGAAACMELIALDNGGGIADPAAALRDGFSTAGTSGSGLGAIRRQANCFDLVSWPNGGAALLARVWPGAGDGVRPDARWGAISIAKPGEEVCGDGFAVQRRNGHLLVLVCDGLGHGLGAATASREAIHLFEASRSIEPEAIADTLHRGLRATRGAAIAVAGVDLEARVLSYSGIGNIAGTLAGPGQSKRLATHNGTAGHVARHIHAFQYSYEPDALLIMHSDGLSSSWSLDRYPGLAAHDPLLIAAVLYRDFRRERDDATVLVARLQ